MLRFRDLDSVFTSIELLYRFIMHDYTLSYYLVDSYLFFHISPTHPLFFHPYLYYQAVGLWTGADDVDHAYTVGAYLRFCQGNFINIKAKDLSTRTKKGKEMVIVGDPMYVVTATRGNAV